MNPGLLDAVDLGNRPGKFSLESSLIIEFLDKLGHAEVFTVKNLETDPASLGQPFRGKGQPQFVDLVGRNQHPFAVGGDLVRRFGILEFLDNFTGIFRCQIGEQGAEIGSVGNKNQNRKRCCRQKGHSNDQHTLTGGKLQERFYQSSQSFRHCGSVHPFRVLSRSTVQALALDRRRLLDLHPHDFLVGLDRLVSYLGHELK